MKNKKTMVIAILALIIIIGVVIYFFFFRKTDGMNSTNDLENTNNKQTSYVYWNDNFYMTSYSSTQIPTGTGLSGTYTTREALATDYSGWANNSIYIKTTKVNGKVTGHTACLWYNNREFCFGPNYWVETGNGGTNHQSAENGVATKNKLQAAMETALGTQADSCYSYLDNAYCYFGGFYCYADANGSVYCDDDGLFCGVNGDGSSGCGS